MRHQKKGRKLGREKGPRQALKRGLATDFILREKLISTEAKVKEIRPVVEKLITVGKEKNLANRRRLLSYLYNENAVRKILDEISPKYKQRRGGYTRIIKLENRRGDNAKMAKLELV